MVAVPPSDIPEGVRKADERLVKVTPAAAKKLEELFAREGEGSLLRIGISGGGCNGLTYKMKFTQAPKRGDLMVESSHVVALVDSKSALYLRGTVLDYSDEMVAGGFKFTNPNAKSSCSCGESFSV